MMDFRSVAALCAVALAVSMNAGPAAAQSASASIPAALPADSAPAALSAAPALAPPPSPAAISTSPAPSTPTIASTIAPPPIASVPAGSATSFAGSFQLMIGLIIVMGLLIGVTWLLKKYGPARSSASATVKIIGGVNVGNRERIIVVEVADQWIVVGVAPGRVNTLSTMPKQESSELPHTTPPEKNFAAWLKQTIDKRNGT